MQTWTNSQPMPRVRARRSPVMRWPIPPMRPSFLMSRWRSCPGCAHSYRRPGVTGSVGPSRASPSWPKLRATVARLRPTLSAICAPVQRHRRRNRSISTMSPLEIARGEWWGRHDRSSRASSPSAARPVHFRTVRSHSPKLRATAAWDSPPLTRAAIRARLCGVVRAFL
jgi:hypothetical protein